MAASGKPVIKRKPVEQRGWCIIFAAGPPWTWRFKISRGGKRGGLFPGKFSLSVCWLWWSLYFIPRSVQSLVVYSEVYRRLKEEKGETP